MPKIYLAIKNKFLKEGMSTADAKTHAAKIYNSMRDKKPSLPELSNKPEEKNRKIKVKH